MAKWVSVDERLPNNYEIYFVLFMPKGKSGFINKFFKGIGQWDKENNEWKVNSSRYDMILYLTHWLDELELPE